MLKMVSGDILMSDAQMIAQGVAPEDHFNQGLALSLRELFATTARFHTRSRARYGCGRVPTAGASRT